MKTFLLVLDIISIIALIIFGIDTINYLKKNQNKNIETIRKNLDKKIKILEILTILVTILGVLLSLNNLFKWGLIYEY